MAGSGTVTKLSFTAGGGVTRLGNFDIDRHALKPEHENYLSTDVVPVLLAGGSARLIGLTSTTGSDEHNMRLSRSRADQVAGYLQRVMGTPPRIESSVARGESAARLAGVPNETEHPAWRSVIVSHWPRPEPPPPPDIHPVEPPTSDRFAIRLIVESGATKKFGVAKVAEFKRLAKLKLPKLLARLGKLPRIPVTLEFLYFEICDLRNSLSGFYIYGAAGLAVGLSVGTLPGPWNRFKTSKPIEVSEFDGLTRFSSAGVWDWSYNVLHLLGTPDGVDGVYMSIDTGRTLGGTAVTTAGPLLLMGVLPAENPFPREQIKKSTR